MCNNLDQKNAVSCVLKYLFALHFLLFRNASEKVKYMSDFGTPEISPEDILPHLSPPFPSFAKKWVEHVRQDQGSHTLSGTELFPRASLDWSPARISH